MGSGSVPAAMLAEARGRRRMHYTADLTIGGETLLYAKSPVVSESGGMYQPYVERFGSIPRGVGFPALSGLANPRLTMSIVDANRSFQKAAGGPGNGEVIGSAASVTLRSFYVPAASHYTRLSGEIKDYNPTGDQKYSVVLGPNETPLKGKLKIPKLTKDDWPTVPEANRDRAGQAVFGEWDSASRPAADDTRGLVQAYLVEPDIGTGYGYWYVSFGHFPDSSITGVFVGAVDETAKFTMRRILRNGRPYTVLEQTSGTAFTIDDDVTVDCTGLGANGDASGTVERNPGDALRIVLSNFVFGEYPVGALPGLGTNPGYRWLVNSTEIDATSFTTVDGYLAALNHEHAFVYTSDHTGFDVVNQWISTFKAPVFWSDEFKLKAGFFLFYRKDLYDSDAIRKDRRDTLTRPVGKTYGDDRLSRIRTNYMYDPVGNTFDRSILQANEDLGFTNEGAIDYTAGGPSALDIG